jgi:hypothetical protein
VFFRVLPWAPWPFWLSFRAFTLHVTDVSQVYSGHDE